MTFVVHQSGGTRAGWRKIKPTKTAAWPCECFADEVVPGPAVMLGTATRDVCVSYSDGIARTTRTNDPCLTRCPDCGKRRP